MSRISAKKIAVQALDDIKAIDINIINTKKISSLFETIIICSATSVRQVAALYQNLLIELKKNKIKVIGSEGYEHYEWVLVDTGDMVVHIMLQELRTHYDIDGIWVKEDK